MKKWIKTKTQKVKVEIYMSRLWTQSQAWSGKTKNYIPLNYTQPELIVRPWAGLVLIFLYCNIKLVSSQLMPAIKQYGLLYVEMLIHVIILLKRIVWIFFVSEQNSEFISCIVHRMDFLIETRLGCFYVTAIFSQG